MSTRLVHRPSSSFEIRSVLRWYDADRPHRFKRNSVDIWEFWITTLTVSAINLWAVKGGSPYMWGENTKPFISESSGFQFPDTVRIILSAMLLIVSSNQTEPLFALCYSFGNVQIPKWRPLFLHETDQSTNFDLHIWTHDRWCSRKGRFRGFPPFQIVDNRFDLWWGPIFLSALDEFSAYEYYKVIGY